MSSGWIKLHRQLTEWEWYDDINTSRLYIHLLLTANHKDNNWRGITIKRGSRLTSLDKLSSETSLSVSKIRTSVKKLILTDEIASESHTQHTVFIVKNYESYQGDDKQIDNPVTNESQTNDKPIATNNNVKNEKNVNNKEIIDFSVLKMTDLQIQDLKRIRKKNKGTSLTQRIVNALAKEFDQSKTIGYTLDETLTEWEVRGWKSLKSEWLTPKAKTISQSYRPMPKPGE
jgi:hypothetical protein|tara:strand:- start:311 stop:1000 length:690 start_codon:yes stop_codon:yes gene_type:complete